MVKVLGRPLMIMTESRVRESKIARPNKVYTYGKIELVLPPELVGRKVKVIALIYEEPAEKVAV